MEIAIAEWDFYCNYGHAATACDFKVFGDLLFVVNLIINEVQNMLNALSNHFVTDTTYQHQLGHKLLY